MSAVRRTWLALAFLAVLWLPVDARAEPCGGVASYGCCDGTTLKYCKADSTLATVNCASFGQSPCDWSKGKSHYMCNPEDFDAPPGDKPKACPGAPSACKPDCTAKACGEDGCGGSCGSCGAAETCDSLSGVCVPDAKKPCGDIPTTGCCDGTVGKICDNGVLTMANCAGALATCAYTPPDQANNQPGYNFCAFVPDSNQSGYKTCPKPVCAPKCDGKTCGSDGCGGTCGTCVVGQACDAAKGLCACKPDCSGKSCGDDGCGGSCGACTGGKACDEKSKDLCGIAKDLETLTLTCPVGSTIAAIKFAEYGTVTGTCPSPQVGACTATGALALMKTKCLNKNSCVSTNWHLDLGDPCENKAKAMAVVATCSAGGGGAVCQCTVNCTGKSCGDDGCGGSCGSCTGGKACDAKSGQCQAPVVTCGKVTSFGLTSPNLTPPANLEGVKDVRTLEYGGVALKFDGTLVAWGPYPTIKAEIVKVTGAAAVAAGASFVLILKKDATVQVIAELATGKASVVPAGLSDVVAVAASHESAMALKADGTVVRWGLSYDSYASYISKAKGVTAIAAGHLALAMVFADGKVVVLSKNSEPMGVPSDLKATAVSVNFSHGLAITPAAKVVAWGSNWSGQIDVPAGLSGVVSVAAVGGASLALKADGTVVAWGDTSVLGTSFKSLTGVTALAVQPKGDFGYAVTCSPACGAISPIGCCDGDTLKTCTGSGIQQNACAAGTCGWNGTTGAFGCATGGASAPNPAVTKACTGVCSPVCTGKACGPNGCGGLCGTCPGGQACGTDSKCICTPKCDGKTCGADGCGGQCGTCPGGTACNAQQLCATVCTPKCDGKSCGSDGCGGQCGVCLTSEKCSAGKCVSDACGGVPAEGCCASATLHKCLNGKTLISLNCAEYLDTCGWQSPGAYYCSKQALSDPSGKVPMQCPGQTCKPSCKVQKCLFGGCEETKECGTDGCGGSCGTCPNGGACSADGKCCKPQCDGKGCGPNGCGGSCGSCGTGYTCDAGLGKCLCAVNCTGKTCGSDGCGGSCGKCPFNTACDATKGTCNCVKQCTGKVCGPDGCGGQCGSCASGQGCSPTGKCEASCKPDCDGKSCGSDGCGGACGTCGAGEFCDAFDKVCYSNICPTTPKAGCCAGELVAMCTTKGESEANCEKQGKLCGWDATAGKYGCVSVANSLDPTGKNARTCPGQPVCKPNCFGKKCGSDGCGGYCGTCPTGKYCASMSGYVCMPDACLKVPEKNCCDGNNMITCSANGAILKTSCTASYGTGGVCGWMGTKYGCQSNGGDESYGLSTKACPASLCIPKCDGKQCGDDGCGGQCGSCKPGWTCSADGKECNAPCVPYCGGYGNYYQCGGDSCGGSCGTCADNQECNKYRQCVPKSPCFGIPQKEGCCDGNTFKYCFFGELKKETCSGSGVQGFCGWQPNQSSYGCGTDGGAEPSGQKPQACGGTAACKPNCDGKQCGPDGCGGWCGQCKTKGDICNADTGKCTAACDGIPLDGCCDGNVLKICQNVKGNGDSVSKYICGNTACGWNPNGFYSCATSGGVDPKGYRQKACPKPDCTADCAGKSCGDDGCGGVCGTCNTGTTCFAKTGKCVSSQTAVACGSVMWEGGCDGTKVKFCSNGSLATQECKVDTKGECGWLPAIQAYGCGGNGADPAGTFSKQAPGATSACVPSCTGKQCGVDGCGGNCGTCAKGAVCQVNGQCGAPQNVYVAPQAGCCMDDATQLVPVEGGGLVKACPDNSQCGFDSGSYSYGCGTIGQDGFVKEDPKGTKARACPACSTPGQAGDGPCTFDGCGKQKGNCYFGTSCDYKTGKCKVDNGGSCSGNNPTLQGGELCGTFNASWACQCDTQCMARGDCCKGFEATCSKKLFGTASCGDGKCDGGQGENCLTCGDCGSCTLLSGFGPLLASPYSQTIALAGTPAAKAENVFDALDSVLPGDAPILQRGLLAYMPRLGVNAGSQAVTFIHGVLPSKAISGVTQYMQNLLPGKQGTGWTNLNAGKPRFGTLRIRPGAPLPAAPSFTEHTSGGYSVAFWVRVPTSMPDVPNPLLSTQGAGGEEICAWSRPLDSTVTLECPKFSGIPRKILDVEAYYGQVANPLAPSGGAEACAKLPALAMTHKCKYQDIQALVEKECLGKTNCHPNPWELAKDPCSPPPHVPNQSTLVLRAVCGFENETSSTVLSVENNAGQNRLRFDTGGQSLRSKVGMKDGEWKHVALTFHPLSASRFVGVTSLYVDGNLEDSTSNLYASDIREFILGAATIDGASASWSNYSDGKVSSLADFDELFLYNRALNASEVRVLGAKPGINLLRVWPALPADQVVQQGTWIQGGKAAVVAVESANLQDRGAGKPLQASEKALGLPAGVKFRAEGPDGELAALSDLALVGWVRVTKATAGKPLMRLDLDGKPQLVVALSASCGGRGVQAWTDEKNKTPVSNCEHGVAEGEWAFVAALQFFGQLAVFVDGHQVGTVKNSATLFEASEDKLRAFEAGDGVDLKWAALVNKPLFPAELAKWRGPGPAVWLDGGVFANGNERKLRDFANFHNNGDTGATDWPLILNGMGDPAKPVAGQGPLKLGSGANDNMLFAVPAKGRFGSINGAMTRRFSFAGRVALENHSSAPMVAQADPAVIPATAYFKSRLACERFWDGPTAKIKCRIEASGLTSSGTWKKWASADRIAQLRSSKMTPVMPASITMDVSADVAISWDGTQPTAAYGLIGPIVLGGQSGMPGKSAALIEVPNGVLPADKSLSGAGVLQGMHLVVPASPFSALSWSDLRLYDRKLSAIELERLVSRSCSELGCDSGGQTCLASGGSGALAVCGDCAAGQLATAGVMGGDCLAKNEIFASCVAHDQCNSGQCYGSRCVAASKSDACVKACGALGRDCTALKNGYDSWSCSAICKDYYSPPEKNPETAKCVWTPTKGFGDFCSSDEECSSGLCKVEGNATYTAAVVWDAPCKAGTCPGYKDGSAPLACGKGPTSAKPPGTFYQGALCPPVLKGDEVADLKGARCAATKIEQCKAEHRDPVVVSSVGLLKQDLVLCPKCDPIKFDNKPIWIKGWSILNPKVCKQLHSNLVLRWMGGKATWDALDQEPSYELFGQFYFNQDTTVLPEQMAQLEKDGVGPELVEFMRGGSAVQAKIRARHGRLRLGDCARGSFVIDISPSKLVTDPKTGATEQLDSLTYTSPYFDPNKNKYVCVANKFPNGTPCPPPGANVSAEVGDSFCESGFCARDTNKCDKGVGRLEVVEPADRKDDQKPKSGDTGSMGLTQQNNGALEVRKVKAAPIKGLGASEDAPKARKFSLAGGSGHNLAAFGGKPAEFFTLSTSMVVTPEFAGNKAEAEFENSVFVMQLKLPMANEPATSCPAPIWKDGKYIPPPPDKKCSVWQKGEAAVPKLPGFKLCTPNPFGCDGEGATKKKGITTCWKKTFIGPVPMLIIAEVVLEACFSTGANIDSLTSAPEFQLVPEINAELKVAGGVGAEFMEGLFEIMAGVKAVITVVNLAFPIRWGMVVVDAYKDGQDKLKVQNLYTAKYYRKIDLELTILKLSLAAFFEVQALWGVAKSEFEYPLFGFEGLKFVWELSKANLQEIKVDLTKDFKPED